MLSSTQYILNQPYFFAGKTAGDTMQAKYSTSLSKYLLEVEKMWPIYFEIACSISRFQKLLSTIPLCLPW